MSWRDWRKKLSFRAQKDIPDGLFVTCEGCQKMIYKKSKEDAMEVCPECDYHFHLPRQKRIDILLDPGSFRELHASMGPGDPLHFVDREPYVDRIRKAQEETGARDAITIGTGTIKGFPTCIGVMDFKFMGGSMGSVVGEKVARITEHALDTRVPLVIVSASGGARMQEGTVSLMQMAKTCCALARLRQAGVLFISVLTNPTTAGVLASFAGAGDIIIAEPKALIGFTGPRVIKETIKQELPPGFQSSEFLLDHGLIDMIVHRRELRDQIARILTYVSSPVCPSGTTSPAVTVASPAAPDNGDPQATACPARPTEDPATPSAPSRPPPA